jgi:SAM-dependent methyltransferase
MYSWLYALFCGDDAVDSDWFFSLVKSARSSLELGVGTGRLLVPFVRAGYAVDGVDKAPDMVSYLRRALYKNRLHATIYQADVARINVALIPKQYELVYAPTALFMQLGNEQHLSALLPQWYSLVAPGGKLALTTYTYRQELIAPTSVLCVERSSRKLRTLAWYDQVLSSAEDEQVRRIERTICLQTRSGNYFKLARTLQWHFFSTHQLLSLLYAAGFSQVELFGDYSFEPYDPDEHSVLCLIAHKD